MDPTDGNNDWKCLLEGLNLYNIDETVNNLVDSSFTVTDIRQHIEKKGNDFAKAELRKVVSNALVLKHIIGRVELSYMIKDCDKSISVGDIERIIQCYQSYIHPEDRKLLQAAVTCVAKEIPSKALTDAEITCKSETLHIVFHCGMKDNQYKVERKDGKNIFFVLKGMTKSTKLSTVSKYGIAGLCLGAVLGGIVAGPLGYAIAIKASGVVIAYVAGSGGLTAVTVGGGTVVAIEGAAAGAAAGAVVGVAAGAVAGAARGVAARFIEHTEYKIIKDK